MDRRDFLAHAALAAWAGSAWPALAAGRANSPWEIGPVIRGRSYSVGMPLHPQRSPEGWHFAFPGPRRSDGHVHYLTRAAPVLGKSRGLSLRYRIEAEPGTQFVPQEYPDRTALLSLFVQRRGDDWYARDRTLYHRWYSPGNRVVALAPGDHELTIRFSENWISVMGSDRARNPREFRAALAEPGRIGLTFGSDAGRGHGIFATGRATFTILGFTTV